MPKLDSRNELTTPVLDDLLLIQDISDLGDGLTGTSKKIEAGTLLAGPSIFVAASGATDQEKRHANYVCDGTADDVEIQAAIDAAEAADIGMVQLSKGTFILTAQLAIDHTHLVGASPLGSIETNIVDQGTELEAHSTFPGATSMVEIEGHGCAVIGVTINGGNYADIGINAVDVNFLTVKKCYFKSFLGSTTQAIRCGGVLGLTLDHCIFRGDVQGYALDAQSTYGSSYYGVNIGHAIGCWFNGRGGGAIRLDGIMQFYDCDIEALTWYDLPIVQIGPNVQSQVGFFGCYWELNRQNFDIVGLAIEISSKVFLSGCQFDAESSANSLAIDATSNFEMLMVCGTRFKDFVTGISISGVASAGATNLIGNTYVNCPTEVNYTASLVPGSTHTGLIQIPGGLNIIPSGGMRFGAEIWTTFTSFDAATAFIHYLNPTNPETLQPGLADYAGQVMILYFVNANTTLDDGFNQFYLRSDADITPPAETSMVFVSDNGTHWQEVGDYSLRLLNDYTITNDNPDRAFDADTVAVDELADVVATLIRDLGMV